MLQVPVYAAVVISGLWIAPQIDTTKNLAPYVSTPPSVVERMLEAASLKPGETVFDLGCGDGRILITAAEKYRAKGVGVELSHRLVVQARDEVERRGLNNLVEIKEANLLDVDLSNADVVMIYLLTESNEKLRPNLEKYLKPGARVVSHDFEIRGWKPASVEEVFAYRRTHRIYVYEVGKSAKK